MNGNTLKDLLPEKLRKDLTPAEAKLLESTQEGAEADFRSGDQEKDNPENSEKWGPERTLRPELLYWLCTDPEAGRQVHAKGIWIWGAKIVGPLDFTSATLLHPLAICKSALEDIELAYAETRNLNFSGSSMHSIRADGLSVNGQLFLIEVTVKGGVRLLGAIIGGQLACNKAIFENPRGYAFNADGISVNGGIIFNKVTAKGEVRFLGAHIRGPLDCIGATFENHMVVAFNADGLSIEGSLFLSGVTANGEVRLLGAEISSQLDCTGATFENPEGNAFNADGLFVKVGMFLSEVKAKGEVRLLSADIGGVLTCEKATFENPKGYAFNADRLSVKGSMFLREFTAKGEVRLPGADIGGQLNCNRATFEKNPEGYAFNADGLSVKGDMFLREVTAKGEVRLPGADIGGQLECNGAIFENPWGQAFNAENLKVTQVLFFTMKKTTGSLNLLHANVGVLVDQEECWPGKGDLILDGFEYGALAGANTPQTAKKRLEWLRLQPKEFFSLQPYEQLAKVFRNSGRESDARAVLIAKQDDLRRFGKLSRPTWAWNWFLGFTIGHGYQSERAILFILLFFLIGSGIFYQAGKQGVIQPSKESIYLDPDFIASQKAPSGYPSFCPIIYSIDVFIPFVNLHQEDFWLPDASRPYGWWFQLYFWIHIIAGWGLSTLAALSLTGLIRKD